MANNNATKVKAYLFDDSHSGSLVKVREVRLLVITDITYAILSQKIKSVFPDLNNQNFAITWQDEEGDNITVSSDEELLQAITFASGGILRMYVTVIRSENRSTPDPEVRESNKSSTLKETTPFSGTEIHPNVLCDGCNGGISGPRYKCLTCDDYDLCQPCLMKNTHNDHDMIRIIAPTRNYATRQWFKPMQNIWLKMARHSAHLERKEEKLKAKMDSIREKHCKRMHRMKYIRENCKDSNKGDATSSGIPGCFQDNPLLFEYGYGPFFEIHGNMDKNAMLKNIGTSVANMLDPLGINVTVDVENSDGEIEPCASCPSKPNPETTSTNKFCQPGGLFGSTTTDQENIQNDSPKSDDPPSLGQILNNITEMSGNLFQHMRNLNPKERKEFAKERFIEVQGILTELLCGVPAPSSDQTSSEAGTTASTEETKVNSTNEASTDTTKITSTTLTENSTPAVAVDDGGQMKADAVNDRSENTNQTRADEQMKQRQTGAISKHPKISGIAEPPTTTLIDVSEENMENSGYGWTILNNDATHVKTTSPSQQPLATKLTMASKVTPSLYPSADLEDGKYQLSLEQMLHMGYSNEGDWLISLIKAKNGDIAAVLDVLHPNK